MPTTLAYGRGNTFKQMPGDCLVIWPSPTISGYTNECLSWMDGSSYVWQCIAMQPNTEFLTPEECAQVDGALMTSQDKFATRVAVYALRSLKQIAAQHETTIAHLKPAQIEDWVYQDESLQSGIDREFRRFFARLVLSSLRPLQQAAQVANVPIEALTIQQVVHWFESEARTRLSESQTEPS